MVPNPHINSVNKKHAFHSEVERMAAGELNFSPALPLTKLGGILNKSFYLFGSNLESDGVGHQLVAGVIFSSKTHYSQIHFTNKGVCVPFKSLQKISGLLNIPKWIFVST